MSDELSPEQAQELASVTLPVTAFSVQSGDVQGNKFIAIFFELNNNQVVYPYMTHNDAISLARKILQAAKGN